MENKKIYDFLIVGAGLYGSVMAHELNKAGYKVLIVDKRSHVGGNVYTEYRDNIDVHIYGAHIFHTSSKQIWDYVNSFVPFNNFVNQVLAFYKGQYYHLPFNMYTFNEIWGAKTKDEAIKKIEEEKSKENIKEITNLEQQAISLVGRTIFEKLIKGYTEKQWNNKCENLPPFIIKRIPLRFEYNNNYFNDIYQGIPIGGYTNLINKLIEGIDINLNTDFLKNKQNLTKIAKFIIYSGPIDEYFDYQLGALEYRSLTFDLEKINKEFYQHNCVINYTDSDVKFTRIIEHKYFENDKSDVTWITKEYPTDYSLGKERYYPINDDKNNKLYEEYIKLAEKEKNILFSGRLGKYKYYDMDDVIQLAFDDLKKFNIVID